jgi:phage terminase large subunit
MAAAPAPPALVEPQFSIDAQIPEPLAFLWDPARFKVAYGGRGSAKSWSFARALLVEASRRPLRILCARETQKSIADSVWQLLVDQIRGIPHMHRNFEIEKASIRAILTGSNFAFAGLKHNINELKSFEGADICWVEEAQAVTKSSWDVLIPTLRKPGSEIWVTFNPDLESDDTYQRFVVNPPPDAIVRKINFRDNPWFPDVLQKEMEHCRDTRPDDYMHIWEGCCISMLQGAIFANELRAVDAEQRITRVPYDRTRPVDCYWDLGYGDLTAVWFVQQFPFESRLIDYMEGERQSIEHYLQAKQARGYLYGKDWLPWDIGMHARQMGSGRSIEELMRQAGCKVHILPRLTKADQINAARTVFPSCWFDREKCADGLQALRHYRYGENKTVGGPSKEPLHDWASHASDAFMYFAIGSKTPRPNAPPPNANRPPARLSAWS